MKQTFTTIFLLVLQLAAFSNKFYSDPVAGNMNNDGSLTRPWASVQAILDSRKIDYYYPTRADTTAMGRSNAGAPLKGGDTILVLNGYQGELQISDMYNKQYIVIMAAPGHQPRFRNIDIKGSMRWELNGLQISPSFAPVYTPGVDLVHVTGKWAPSYYIRIKGNTMFTKPDVSGLSAADWNSQIANVACEVDAQYSEVCYNNIRNFSFGLILSTHNSTAHHNVIENFNGDASRVLGNDCVFEYNTIKNVFATDGEHRDMLQSFTNGRPGSPPIERVIIRNNFFISKDNSITNPLNNGDAQGIGLFDGFFNNWLIENNVVVTNHYHGITLVGANNCKVRNNTVISLNDAGSLIPFIMVDPHKDGRVSTNNVVANNIINTPVQWKSTGTNKTNLLVGTGGRSKTTIFMFINAYDLHLRVNSTGAVNTGDRTHAAIIDFDNNARDLLPDIGAFEFMLVLPVTWGNFTAVKHSSGGSLLQWNTLQEKDNALFTIEHSTNGKDFTAVGTVKAANKATGAQYSFLHHDAAIDQINYYRIKQTDKNGQSDWSVIRAVAATTGKEVIVKAGPNPVKDVLNITISARSLLVTLADANGKTVKSLQLSAGTHRVSLRSLPAGVYHLTAWQFNEKVYSQQILKL